jgi:hemerythrin
MELAGCPDSMISNHRAAHEELVKAIFDVTQKITADTTADALSETGELLRNWLIEHILDEDMRYAPFIIKLKDPLGKLSRDAAAQP